MYGDITPSLLWRDSFACVTWCIHVCDKPHTFTWHDSFDHVERVVAYSACEREWVPRHTLSRVTHMNEARCAYERVVSHTWMRHVAHMNESCYTHKGVIHVYLVTAQSCQRYEWVMSHIFRYEWVISHIFRCEWVMSHIFRCGKQKESRRHSVTDISVRYATHMNESRQTKADEWVMNELCEWVTSHTWVSHVIQKMNESRQTKEDEWVTSQMNELPDIWMSYLTHMSESYYTNEWVTSYPSSLSRCNNGGGGGNFSKVKRLVAKG